MLTINQIDSLAKDYRDARDALADEVLAIEREIAAIRVRHAVKLRRLLGTAANRLTALEGAIDKSRGQFARPKTRVVHGMKIGLRKQPGSLRWDDDDQVVKLIRRHFEEQFETLVKVTEKPLKTPLAQLAAADLKKLGIQVTDDTDVVLIQPTDADIDKLIAKIVEDAAAKDEEAA